MDIMTNNKIMDKLIQDLQEAKNNVLWLLDNPDGLASMHGIEYWAGRVEKLRAEIKSNL